MKADSRKIAAASVAVVTVGAVWLFLQSRQTMYTYIYDDWKYIARTLDFKLSSVFADHNGHLSIFPNTIYLVVLRIWGLSNQRVFDWLAIAGHLATMIAVAGVVHRRQGWLVGYLAAVALAVSGVGAEIWLWGTNIGFSASMGFMVMAVDCFDQADSSGYIRWRIGVLALLLLSIASSGAGVAGLLVFAMLVLFRPGRRQMWWTVALPLVAYLVWFARFGSVVNLLHLSVGDSLRFMTTGMAWAAAGSFGLGLTWGYLLIFGVVVLIAAAIARTKFDVRRLFWPMFLVVFWAMTAYGRGWFGQTNVSRYRWVSVVAIVLAISDVMPRVSLPRRVVVSATAVASLLIALSVIRTDHLTNEVKQFTVDSQSAEIVRDTIALHLRGRIPGEIGIHNVWNEALITSSQYFRAVDRFGEPPTLPISQLGSVMSGLEADRALIDFGFFERSLRKSDNDCLVAGTTSQMVIPEGGSVRFRLTEPRLLVFTRFLQPGNRQGINELMTGAGTFEFRPGVDGLVQPTTISVVDGSAVLCASE